MILAWMQTTAQRDYRKCSPISVIATGRGQLQLLREGTVATSVPTLLLLFLPIVQAPQVNFIE
jgi:hypothetical protein